MGVFDDKVHFSHMTDAIYNHDIKLGVFLARQGNSVARDLPPTGSEANTTIFVYIYIGYRFPTVPIYYRENHLPFNSHKNSLHVLLFGETTSHLTSKWRGTFQFSIFF